MGQEHLVQRFPRQNDLYKKKSLAQNISPSWFIELPISYESFHVIAVNFLKIKTYENDIKNIIKYSMHYEYVLVNKTFDNFMYQFLFTEYIVFSK